MPKKKKKLSKAKKHRLLKAAVLLIVLIILFIVLCYLTPGESDTLSASGEYTHLELPAPVKGEQIVEHTGYILSYNEEAEQPSYVCYELTREEVYGALDRADDFREDKSIRTGSAILSDYKGSGYDRGHMAPAADFKWSAEAMSDTFYLSNMSPQVPSFNRGIWGDLEAVVRQMAVDNEKICVATGPVLTDGPYKTIGKNNVAVPNQYYKVILDYTDPDIKAIGFVLPNSDKTEKLETYIMSVDEVEEITGLDFFYQLPDEEEAVIESSVDVSKWNLKPYTGTKDENRTLIDNPVAGTGDQSEVLDLFLEVFTRFRHEVFALLGITDIARSLGLI